MIHKRCFPKPFLLLALLGLVLATLLAAQARDTLPVPGVAGYKTLKADFHCHTVFSDGEVWPTTRIAEAWREGLDVLAITDHAGYNPHKKDLPVNLTRPYALAREAAERAGIVLIPAVEIAERDLHCNALFVKDPNAFLGLKLREALREARSQDAFVFWNHPGWKRTAEWFPEIASLHKEGLIQGVELVNGYDFYPEVFPWIEQKSLVILSNSDVHAPTFPQYPARKRPVTLVFARTADAAGVRDALFSGRTAAWMGGQVWGAEQYLRGLWEGAVKIEGPQLVCRAGGSGALLRLRNESAVPFDLSLRSSPGWMRAGGGNLRAESTLGIPVTITRDAPGGSHEVELELEITNLHVSPGRNLIVKLPVRVEAGPRGTN